MMNDPASGEPPDQPCSKVGPFVLEGRMKRVAAVLACPECRGNLQIGAAIVCTKCGAVGRTEAGRFDFLMTRHTDQTAGRADLYSRLQRWLLLRPRLYSWVVGLLAPVWTERFDHFLDSVLDASDTLVLNLGSGARSFHARAIDVDMQHLSNVALVCDLERRLPLADRSVDAVACIAVAEHLKNWQTFTEELERILKPAGELLIHVPFLYPFHMAPNDYRRWTFEGVRAEFEGYQVLRYALAGGPVSVLLSVLSEAIPGIVSCGHPGLCALLRILVLPLLAPFKILDAPLMRLPVAKVVSAGFVLHLRKLPGSRPAMPADNPS
jgi:SAM-dependent methyltransferase